MSSLVHLPDHSHNHHQQGSPTIYGGVQRMKHTFTTKPLLNINLAALCRWTRCNRQEIKTQNTFYEQANPFEELTGKKSGRDWRWCYFVHRCRDRRGPDLLKSKKQESDSTKMRKRLSAWAGTHSLVTHWGVCG